MYLPMEFETNERSGSAEPSENTGNVRKTRLEIIEDLLEPFEIKDAEEKSAKVTRLRSFPTRRQ